MHKTKPINDVNFLEYDLDANLVTPLGKSSSEQSTWTNMATLLDVLDSDGSFSIVDLLFIDDILRDEKEDGETPATADDGLKEEVARALVELSCIKEKVDRVKIRLEQM